MSLVLRVGHGVHLTGDVPHGWLPPGLDDALAAELARWHAAASEDGADRDVLRVSAEDLADRIAAVTGTVVHVVTDDGVRTFAPPEPTPWGTGLVLAGATAVFTLVAYLALYGGLAAISPVLAAVVTVVVVACLLPTAERYRTARTWRWFVFGGLAGVALSWTWLLLEALT